MKVNSDLIIYQDGELELKVSLKNETIWLRQDEISCLYEKDRTVITRHIKNILRDKEVDKESNVQKMHFPDSDKPVNLYSLDIILAVGYRTNSAKAIKFRQWSTNVLRNYILNGYAINTVRITHDRFKNLEKDVQLLRNKVDDISKIIDSGNFIPDQGIFFEGQIFDAYNFVSDLFRKAEKSIVIVDNYVDDTVLLHLTKIKKDVQVKIVTKSLSDQFKLDISKFEDQYFTIEVKVSKDIHDRFIIIDGEVLYHLGASLKDLGRKLFGFTKMDKSGLKLLKKIK